jgi:hypothetical protein
MSSADCARDACPAPENRSALLTAGRQLALLWAGLDNGNRTIICGFNMRRFNFLTLFFLSMLAVAGIALADVKIEKLSLGPDGDSTGCSISPHGEHVAVLAAKGSRFVVLLDGVEGPKIEALLNNVMGSPVQVSSYWTWKVPVLFSDDGAHSVYSAKVGNEYIVVLDGKELTRGPITPNTQANLPLTFSAGGKHLFYMDVDAAGKYRIVVDGKPGPPSYIPPQLVVSTDGAHYAYVGYENDRARTKWGVVDGRQVNYFGENLQYSGKNVLVSTLNMNGTNVFLLNGKPKLMAYRLDPMWMSPDGNEIAIVITPKSTEPGILTVNGKMIPETQALPVESVYFSPDGKRYAALCHTKAGAKFMIIDGKKGSDYQDIPHEMPWYGGNHWTFVNGSPPVSVAGTHMAVPGFTADSSKFVYVAGQGARQFLVIEDQESSGYQSGLEPVLSAAGHRIGFIGIAPNGKQHVIIDDKDQEYGPSAVAGGGPARIHDLTFTPDGTRSAFINGPNVCVDWVALPGMADGAQYAFSPDNKHVIYMANDGGHYGLFLDGKIVDTSPGNMVHSFFSTDSQHLFWLKTSNLQAQGTKDTQTLYVDGKPVTHISGTGEGGGTVVNFEFSADGVMTFVARTDDTLRRFRVTLPTDTSISTMLAAASAPKGK